MAVFGFQLLLTIIVLSILNKLSPKYSFARWILTKGGLVRYRHPTNEQIKEAMKIDEQQQSTTNNVKNSSISNNHNNNSKKYRKTRRHNHDDNSNNRKPETFYVPKNLQLALDCEPLTLFNLVQLPYYQELQWLIDFSLSAIFVYFTTEFYNTFLQQFIFKKQSINDEYNLSIVWCLLSIGFVLKILFSITAKYFYNEESIGERSICIVCFCIFLLVSMIILIADEELLEFDLNNSYKNFSYNAYRLLEQQGIIEHSYGPTSLLLIKFWLAIICASIGSIFAFPSLRLSQMHFDALIYADGNYLQLFLLHLSFISPLLIVLSWVKPVARYYFVEKNSITNISFESGRLLLILLILLLRFCLFRRYLQSYLNVAPQKLTYLHKQTGKITNIDVQKLIARIGHYLCVVSLQYLTPLLLCLFITLLTKSTGNYKWTGTILMSSSEISSLNNNYNNSITNTSQQQPDTILSSTNFNNENRTAEDVAKLTITMLRDVFNPIVLRGFMNFLLWWTCSCWFFTSVFGFVYNSYFRT